MKQLRDLIDRDKGNRFWEGEYESDDGAEVTFTLSSIYGVNISITPDWLWSKADLEELKSVIELIIKDIE